MVAVPQRTLSALILGLCVASQTAAFMNPAVLRPGLRGPSQRAVHSFARVSTQVPVVSLKCSAEVPSWEEIGTLLPNAEPAPAPVLTLYRDTNAWCPFCERVWLALLAKGIPFDEKLVSLYNKPDWYIEMVPTGLVPAIKIHANDEVMWESNDILKRIEGKDFFADYPTLYPPSEKEKAEKMMDEVQANMISAVRTVYGAVNTTEELAAIAKEFEKDLDKMDAILGESKSPFFLDSGFSVVDCSYVPIFERLAVQLPSKVPIELRGNERWPHLNAWFDALENEVPAYQGRVQGDAYSWLATISMLPGQSGMSLTRENRTEAAQAEARELLRAQLATPPSAIDLAHRQQAVRALLANYQAVVKDAVSEAKTQTYLQRLESEHADEVDRALRRAAVALLDETTAEAKLQGATEVEGKAAQLVAARLCVPRDMGPLQAAALRSGLGSVAAAAAGSQLVQTAK